MVETIISVAWDFLKAIPSLIRRIISWWNLNLPAGKVLGDYLNNKTSIKIYVKDLIVPGNTIHNPKLFSNEGNIQQINPNINKVWPEVESRAVATISNLLGELGKSKNIFIVELSKGYNEWTNNMIVLGAQAVKSREFYEVMNNVGYGVNDDNIYDFITKKPIEMDLQTFGYGIILKAQNPQNNNYPAFLLGGYGVLGTEAAVFYFCNNIALLGKEFGRNYFSIVIKARIASGSQSTVRIKKLDKQFVA